VPGPLPIGKVSGFRGRAGELTVRVASGEAGRWVGLGSVSIGPAGEEPGGGGTWFEVESARAYRDRLVLKLRGVDDPSAAEALKGRIVAAPPEQVPELPDGVHYVERLVGLEVRDETARVLGAVTGVLATGGVDVLEIETPVGGELLVPMARSIVTEISEEGGFLTVRLPEGLEEGGEV